MGPRLCTAFPVRAILLVFPAGAVTIGTAFCRPPEIWDVYCGCQNNGRTPQSRFYRARGRCLFDGSENLQPNIASISLGQLPSFFTLVIIIRSAVSLIYIFDNISRKNPPSFPSPSTYLQACRCIVSHPTTLCAQTAPSTPPTVPRPLLLTQSRHTHHVQSPSCLSWDKSAPTTPSFPICPFHPHRAQVLAQRPVEGVAHIRHQWNISLAMTTRTHTPRSSSRNSTYFTP